MTRQDRSSSPTFQEALQLSGCDHGRASISAFRHDTRLLKQLMYTLPADAHVFRYLVDRKQPRWSDQNRSIEQRSTPAPFDLLPFYANGLSAGLLNREDLHVGILASRYQVGNPQAQARTVPITCQSLDMGRQPSLRRRRAPDVAHGVVSWVAQGVDIVALTAWCIGVVDDLADFHILNNHVRLDTVSSPGLLYSDGTYADFLKEEVVSRLPNPPRRISLTGQELLDITDKAALACKAVR